MYTHRGILDAMSDQPRHHQVLDDLLPQHRALRHQIPQVYQRFVALGDAALTDGALSRKVKELVALAIAVVQGCDGCVASHAQAAVRAGATAQEAAEAIGVTILMHVDRPPSTVLVPTRHFANSLTQRRPSRRGHRADRADPG